MEKEILDRGLELKKLGHYEKALQVWSTALVDLDTPSLRIALAYIELATAQNLKAHYGDASKIYTWGLSGEEIKDIEVLKKELDMLHPIMDEITYNRCQEFINTKNSKVYNCILNFWSNLDPTLSTNINERLLEHWERIAYVKQNFTKQNDPPYGTDDRGPVYIRYGKPDRILSGVLQLSRGEVMHLCSGTDLPCNPEPMANTVTSLHQQPYYEIWIYNRPNNEMKYNLVMIFGDKALGGFGKLDTVEDFIPSRAFSFSNRFTFGNGTTPSDVMSPGMIMQWIYYKQLATRDFYFADQFSRMEWEWDRKHSPPMNPNPYIGKHAGPLKEQEHHMATIKNLQKAPAEISTYEKELPNIVLKGYQYRFLNETNEPFLATFLESKPQPIFINDLAINYESMVSELPDSATVADLFSNYELYHGLKLKDEEGNFLTQHQMSAELLLDPSNKEPSSSVFLTPYISGNTQQLLFAELHNFHSNSSPSVDSPFPNSLRGLGRLDIEQPDPLNTDPNKLEMSDLILGYQMQLEKKDALFPFVVSNDRKIPQNEDLVIHVEVYHLRQEANGIASFKLSYELLPVNWLGWTKEKQQEFNLTLNIEVDQLHYSEDLQIKTRQLSPGKYVLRMKAFEPINGQSVEKEIEFEVVE